MGGGVRRHGNPHIGLLLLILTGCTTPGVCVDWQQRERCEVVSMRGNGFVEVCGSGPVCVEREVLE